MIELEEETKERLSREGRKKVVDWGKNRWRREESEGKMQGYVRKGRRKGKK